MADKKKKGGEEAEEGSENGEVQVREKPDWLAILYSDPRELKTVQLAELENATMKTIARELRTRLEKHDVSQNEIMAHLTLEINKKEAHIQELKTQKEELIDTKQKISDEHKNTLSDKEKEYKQQIDDIMKQLDTLSADHGGMQNMLEEKVWIENELRVTTENLEKEKRLHTMEVSSLERRNVMEKQRLKDEMLHKIRETKLSLLAMTEDQLHTTTKRTIMENEQMTAELQYQSRETERLIKLNHKLMKDNRVCKQKLELSEQAQEMLVKRAKKLQVGIGKLNNQLSQRHRQQLLTDNSNNSSDPQKSLLHSQDMIDTLDSRTADLESMVVTAQQESKAAKGVLDATRKETADMLSKQDEALTFLLMCIEDVKLKLTQHPYMLTALNTEPIQSTSSLIQEEEKTREGFLPSINHRPSSAASDTSERDENKRFENNFLSPDGSIDLEKLHSQPQRDLFLDMLIRKFNQFSPQQISLLTQM